MTELILFLTGIVVGAMNAVAGGGMLIGFPMMVALGVPPLTANATGSIITAPGQLASAWGYRTYIRRIPRRFIILVPPLLIGAAAGALTLRNTSASDFAQLVPWLVLFGVLLFAFQPFIHLHLKQHIRGKKKALPPLLLIALAMLPLAFYGGYFGAGFGFIMLAFLSFTKLPDVHIMNVIKNIGATCVSATSVVCLYSAGLIDWRIGTIMATGSIIGGYSGARLSQRMSSHWLRIAVIVIGLSAAVYLLLQEY